MENGTENETSWVEPLHNIRYLKRKESGETYFVKINFYRLKNGMKNILIIYEKKHLYLMLIFKYVRTY